MKKVSQFLYGALAIITTALLGTACMDDLSNQFDPMDGVVKIIPYTINATSVDTVTTKVTANIDKKMLFEDNDILIITGDQISGTLSLIEKKGTPRGVKGVFRGTLEWKGSGDTPPDDWDLNARVISENDKLNGLDTFTGAITAETGEAVQKYSLLTGSSTYQAKNFTFSQGTSFIKFTISFEPIPDEGDYTAVVTNENGTTTLATGSVYIDDEGKTEFTLALPGATVLDHAKVTINGIDIKFGGKTQVTLTPGALYEVTRFYSDDLNSPLTFEAAADGVITINIPEEFNAPFTGITYYKNNEAGVLVKGDDPSVAYKTTEIPVVIGDKVTFFGDNDAYNDDKNPITINCSNLCYVYGNVMSLVQSSNFASLTVLPGEETFAGLFSGMKSNNRGDSGSSVIPNHITNHASRKLVLPATRLNVCCYQYMFDHCVDLVKAPELPAQNLPDQCYEGMFASCTALTDVYDLTVENVGESSCMEMFEGCSSLRNAPQITVTGSTRDAEDAFRHMFTDCINLVNVPDIHIPDLSEEASSCFSGMFEGCTSLVVAPQFDLPLTSNLPGGCFKSAFRHCESLTTPPELPFVNLGVACYSDMFAYCTRLSDAPVLPATVLPVESYSYMFYNCSSLKHIKCLAKNISAYICLENWTEGVYPTGTFERDPDMWDWPLNSANGIPVGWTVYPDLPNDYTTPLTLEATADGTIYIDNPLHFDNIWYTIDGVEQIPHPGNVDPIRIDVTKGQTVGILGHNDSYATAEWVDDDDKGHIVITATNIRSTMDCYIYGNIMSLIDDIDFATLTVFKEDDQELAFCNLFAGNTHLINSEHRKLVLPATILSGGCYWKLFEGCTGLTEAPALPATYVANLCYQEMFKGCTGLTTAPALPAVSLKRDFYDNKVEDCYLEMFSGCTGLTQAPALPATTLCSGCYDKMFQGCTGLTQLPASLPAPEIDGFCYRAMFKGCTSLETVPYSFLPAMRMRSSCYEEMFMGCTSLVAAPALPADELNDECYESMFEGCTSLVRAPELPATYFAKYCYAHMFKGCSSLNYIKCQATSQSSSGYGTEGWVEGVAASGTFVTAEGAFFWATGPSGIPENWTIEGRGESYSMTYDLENCSLSFHPGAIAVNSSYNTALNWGDSHRLSSVQVTMGGTDITSSCYNQEAHTISIASVTGNVYIKAVADYTDHFDVSYHLTGVSSTNTSNTALALGSYSTELASTTSATELNVTVKMRGDDITSQVWNSYDRTINIPYITGDIEITAESIWGYFSVDVQADNCYRTNWSSSVSGGTSYENTFTPHDGYVINSVYVSMDGEDITEQCYKSSTHTVHIDQVTGDLYINVSTKELGYSVKQNLGDKITSSFKDETIPAGKEFYAMLTPDIDYTITSVVVTMGGVDVTKNYYDGMRTITIYSVTGDIEITASASYDPENKHAITYSRTNAIIDNMPETIHHLATYEANISPQYPCNSVNVKIRLHTPKEWEDVTSQCWDESKSRIYIPYVTGDLQITATGSTIYSIKAYLTKCSLSYQPGTISAGNSYDADITPNKDYTLETVTVIMGGYNITSSCYSAGHIHIDAVTGDVDITAIATGGSETASVYYDMKDDIYSSNTEKTVTIGKDYSTTLTSSSSFKIMVKHNGKEDTYSAKDDGSGKYSYYLKISPVEGDISITAYH